MADVWTGIPAKLVWSDTDGVALASEGPEEPLLRLSLRFSNTMTFADLAFLAKRFTDLQTPNGKSRETVLRTLGDLFGVGDLVCQLDVKAATKSNVSSEFLSEILGRMDLDEKQEFQGLQEKFDKEKKEHLKKRWSKNLQEKKKDEEAGPRFGNVFCFGLSFIHVISHEQAITHIHQ